MRKNCLVQSCTEQSLGSAPQRYLCWHQTSCTQHHSPGQVPWNTCTALLSRVCRMEPRNQEAILRLWDAGELVPFPGEVQWYQRAAAAITNQVTCLSNVGNVAASQTCWLAGAASMAGRSSASVLRDAPILSSPKEKVNFEQEG